MTERRSGHGASWFVIGFLAGVAATLAALIYAGGRPARQAEAEPAPPVVTYTPPRVPRHRPLETPPASASPSVAPAVAGPPAAVDEQVQEDAAATGMTSRAPSHSEDLH